MTTRPLRHLARSVLRGSLSEHRPAALSRVATRVRRARRRSKSSPVGSCLSLSARAFSRMTADLAQTVTPPRPPAGR